MKRLFHTLLLSLLTILLSLNTAMAQDMATEMHSNGKIYVVVFVLATIFAGILGFLVYLERRIKKLESKK